MVLLFYYVNSCLCPQIRRLTQGYFGECGLRGGYMEVHGIGAEVSVARSVRVEY